MPDGGLVLPSGLVVALEYEQSARSVGSAINKLAKYVNLMEQGLPMPLVVVTPTLSAAKNFVKALVAMCPRHVLATTLKWFSSGPYGYTRIALDGTVRGTPGVFGYQLKGDSEPSFRAALDRWDKLERYPEWRVRTKPLALGEWADPDPVSVRRGGDAVHYGITVSKELCRCPAKMSG